MASPNHTHRGRRFLPHEPRAIIPFLHRMRKTKIICTLGPATEKAEMVRQLIQKGADVFRFNMSHAEHGWVRPVSLMEPDKWHVNPAVFGKFAETQAVEQQRRDEAHKRVEKNKEAWRRVYGRDTQPHPDTVPNAQ